MPPNHTIKIYLLLAGLILAWSLSWPAAKVGLIYMPPLWYSAARALIGTVAMFSIVAAIGRLRLPRRQDWWLIAGIGIFQIAIFMLLATFGLSKVSAGQSAVLTYTTPIWLTPLAFFLFKERLTPLQLIGVVLGILGVLIIFNPLTINWHDSSVLLGNSLLILGAISWSIAILIARYSQWHSTPIELICWQLLLGLVLISLTAYVFEPVPTVKWNFTLISSLLYTGIIATAFGYWSTVVVSKELPSNTVSVSLLSVPVLSLITASIFLKEKMTWNLILATVFIMLGLSVILYSNLKLLKRQIQEQ